MLNIGNQLPCSYSVYNPNFRSSSNVTKPNLEINNIGGDSLQSLASYNIAQLGLDNKTKNNILKPFQVPNNIDEIKGERIYNSEGKLVEIVDEDERYKTIYKFNDNISYNMIKTDKKTNIIYQQILEGTSLHLHKKLPSGKVLSTDYENNVPVQIDEYFYSKDKEQEQTITYLLENNTYSISQRFNSENGNVSRFLDFDKDGKCQSAFEDPDRLDDSSKVKENNINIDDIDLTNLKPEPYYNVDYNEILNIEGKKEYYSNGKLEKIIANDGKTYCFNLSGELTNIEDEKCSITFDTKEDTICSSFEPNDFQQTKRKLENGGEITTKCSHEKNSLFADVFYENPSTNEEKSVTYKDGQLISYYDRSKGISVDYDENGNLLKVTESD